MGAGSLSLGGTTLPAPAPGGYKRERQPRGTRFDMADGSVAYDHVAYKYLWTVHWHGLTATQRNTLKTAYENTAAQTFDDWDGVTGSILTLLHPWHDDLDDEIVVGDVYNVDLTFEEV